ncbi:MAG: hypothetical protein GXP13_06425 [Gammaproteobacteria bacterium]|nr:hypothetical protein [Gammaproteobacteria bacterium]
MYYKPLIYKFFIPVMAIILSACSAPSNDVFKKNAEVIATKLFNHLAAKEYTEVIKLYDPRFFERISPTGWVDSLEKLEDKIGAFKSVKQTASNVEQGFNRNSAVTTVLVFRVQYEKTYSIQKLTIISDADATNMRIIGHYIDFPEIKNNGK